VITQLLALTAVVGLTFASVTAQTPPPGMRRVETIEQGRKKVVIYDAKGAVIETSEQVEEKDLPKPVFDAVHSHRRAIFVSALRVTRKGGVEYQITVRGSRKTAMVAKADGTVLSFR
jgi:hypothetical protein